MVGGIPRADKDGLDQLHRHRRHSRRHERYGCGFGCHPIFLGSDGGIFKPSVPLLAHGRRLGERRGPRQRHELSADHRPRRHQHAPHDGAVLSTSLYFGTQDNYIWASADGGETWPHADGAEGYDIEARQDARPGEPITVGYVEIGSNWSEQFADANLVNQRLVPNVDQNGQPFGFRVARSIR